MVFFRTGQINRLFNSLNTIFYVRCIKNTPNGLAHSIKHLNTYEHTKHTINTLHAHIYKTYSHFAPKSQKLLIVFFLNWFYCFAEQIEMVGGRPTVGAPKQILLHYSFAPFLLLHILICRRGSILCH